MGQSISYPQEFPLQIHRLAAFSFHQFSAIVPAPRYISSSSVSPPLFPLPSIPPSSIYPFFVLSSLSALTRSAFAFFPVPVPVSSWLLVFFLITANSGSPFIYSLPAIDAPFANLSFRSRLHLSFIQHPLPALPSWIILLYQRPSSLPPTLRTRSFVVGEWRGCFSFSRFLLYFLLRIFFYHEGKLSSFVVSLR